MTTFQQSISSKKLLSKSTVIFALSLGILLYSVPQQAKADADLDKGKAVYAGVGACAGCHGDTGAGDGAAAAALTPKPRSFVTGQYAIDTDKDGKTGTETDLLNIISNGAAAYGGSPMMVGRADIPEADRKALVKYVLSLKK